MKPEDRVRLEQTIQWMEAKARSFGLDFFEMRYEICPADVVYTIAGFGMPTRYSHWSFGKQYYRQKLDFDLGISRIYELVINSDPCYAFLLDSNTVLQNEMIVAHVLGHSDFFKHNARFRYTNRRMVDSMAAAAERIRKYEETYGIDRVEEVLDAALSIQEHVDASFRARRDTHQRDEKDAPRKPRLVPGAYDDLWSIGEERPTGAMHEPKGTDEIHTTHSNNPASALCKDLLHFILTHSRHLEDWERDIVSTVRDEMLYFWPQLETKIMNEGWATYWHTKLMQERELTGQDAIDFAHLSASVTQPNRYSLNPYNVGYAIWRDIEQRYGTEKMFEVRECDSDVSFIRNYLNQDIVDQCELYLFEKRVTDWVITERDYKVIRDLLVQQRTNAGFPVLYVTEDAVGAYDRLCITHSFEGQELDVEYIERTLPRVYRLWGRPVTLKTIINAHPVEFAYDGERTQRKVV
jgi:stage V sporulation protein R